MRKEGRQNPAAFDKLKARIDEIGQSEVAVGWFESARYENGTPVAAVAAYQEFGVSSRSIPPRPFMRPTVNEKKPEWRDLAARGAKAMLMNGESATSVLDKIGFQIEGDIAATISRIESPPLSPITILLRYWRRQGRKITGKTVGEAAREIAKDDYEAPEVSQKPLVDTGIMLQSISHEVRKSK